MTPVSRRLSFRRPVAGAAIWLLGCLVWTAGAIRSEAQATLLQRNYDKDGKTRIEIESVFPGSVSRGYLPVRVTVRNATLIDRTWNLTFDFSGGWNEMTYRSTFSVSAAAGAEAVSELLVPVPTSVSGGSTYRQITVKASSPGLPSEENYHSNNLSTDWPSLAISRKLADRNITRLDGSVNSSGMGVDTFGSTFDPAKLPGDWRAYTGLDALLITEEEWKAAPPGARLAMLEWSRLGGRLDLYTRQAQAAQALESLELVDAGLDKANAGGRGLGKVRAWTWNGQDLEARQMMQRYKSEPNLAKALGEDFRSDWPLHRIFGTKEFNPLLVVLLLIAFGVVVGPVNLFVLAKPGRRQRLFVTTPIISLAASLLIMLLILLSDGIGGSGKRLILANLEPGASEKRLYVTQEQISRTGVMLGTAFQIGEPVFLSPVMIPPSEWNRLMMSSSPIASYSLSGNTYRGDWYQSRSEQGHYLQAVRPTRSRIELQAPSPDGKAPPALFSSLEFRIDELFYRDDLGMVWRASGGPIAGGEKIALEPVDFTELEKWWRTEIAPLSPATRKQAAHLWKNNGRFFAISTDPQAGFVETLGSIRWKDDRAIVHGPVLTASGGAPETSAAQ